jgi:ATP-dependent Lon protease
VTALESILPDPTEPDWLATLNNLRESASQLVELKAGLIENARSLVIDIADPGQLLDFLAFSVSFETAEKQAFLEELDVRKRARGIQSSMHRMLEIAGLEQKLKKEVATQFNDAHRRAYLLEQEKAIRHELGEEELGTEEEVADLRKRLEQAKPPADVLAEMGKELARLKFIPPASPEYAVIVSYVETVADLPWAKLSEDHLDLKQARATLDRDHYDLEKVKRRLVEYLAVRKLNPQGHGPILCFVGPPGVGKTSLGQSIADALGRKFSRMSLGGIRDEAEIRGHRRTYVASMPGRVIQELRRVGTRNPVMMLDEIDKIGADFRGDPSSALLEVLDPRQNNAFVDRYLDIPFDLSQVIFIATANYLDPVPPALRDRMEVLELAGYTEHEKLQIALKYLVPRQLEENGLKLDQCAWSEQSLVLIIRDYTHEAGVRELERQVGAVCRAVAAKIAGAEIEREEISPEAVEEILGAPRYIQESKLKTSKPGVVTGLAYTPYGGEILYIEAVRYPGKGQLLITGQIGNVMKESAQAALSLVRSRCKELGIGAGQFEKYDTHIHVPSGAVPKDGPSAGLAMLVAIASLYTGAGVAPDLAMTGEITLRGRVLPIGGLKEKALAAMRAEIKTVLIPRLNEKDLAELPAEVKEVLEFVLADSVDEVVEAALRPRAVSGGKRA